ncbi:hypothetical protein LCGC14_2830650 [marine sediment metagenome]|uniref:Uncharacterized protein n=1 Tax=marine sediment metagenome TaxID=412755 RepID=A0A0F8YE59_9ZZZZ
MPARVIMAHTTASMSSTTGAVLAVNNDRKYALIVNDGSVDVYLNLGASATANAGIRINASGGSYEISREAGNLTGAVINGITVSGTATVIVTEGT